MDLDEIKVPKFKRALTKLRLGIIEIKGNNRYTQPGGGDRCVFCDETEDELHFLLKCPTYKQLRDRHIGKYWITLNGLTLKDLVQNSNKDIRRGIAIYTLQALKVREDQM